METLEQQRAAYAWKRVQGCTKDYVNLAKAAPALIMNSGLMQTLAFYESKKSEAHRQLNGHLCQWLHERGPAPSETFEAVMDALHEAEPADFRRATEETLAVLRWIRQFAAAVAGEEN